MPNLEKLLLTARALQDQDLTKQAGTELAKLLKTEDIATLQVNSPEIIAELAQTLGLDQKYVQRALQNYGLDKEQMRKDIQEMNARPTSANLHTSLFNAITTQIFSTLNQNLPMENLEMQSRKLGDITSTSSFSIIHEHEERQYVFLRKKVRKEEPIANVEVFSMDDNWHNFTINAYHPIFLASCKETIKNLTEEFYHLLGSPGSRTKSGDYNQKTREFERIKVMYKPNITYHYEVK